MSDEKTDAKQSIDALTQRYNRLHTRKIEAETNLKTAQQQLDELKKQAREQYGTDDLAALTEKLREMEAENEKKRAEYQAALEKIESDLNAVEEAYNNPEAQTEKK
ncbi:MAG: hypothetical protein ACQERN_07045 [Thermodesulfobacteriota bacterium]